MQTLREILMATERCTQIEPTQTPSRILLITTKSNLDQGHQWLDDNLLPLFTNYLPKNPKFIPDPDTPVAHRIDMRAANKLLAEYVEALCQDIKPVATKTNAPTPYAQPPPPKTPRLVSISFAQAVKNNLQTTTNDSNEQGQKKKARNADTISNTTEHSSDTTQASMVTTHIQNLKNEILNTVCQELASLLKTDLTPIHNEIKTVQQMLTNKIDQQTQSYNNSRRNSPQRRKIFKNRSTQIIYKCRITRNKYNMITIISNDKWKLSLPNLHKIQTLSSLPWATLRVAHIKCLMWKL